MHNFEYFKFIKTLEEERKTEQEIVNILEKKLLECEWDKEECYNINDALIWHGYKYRFTPLPLKTKKFERFEYAGLVKGVGKSLNQTLKLMKYLREIHDYRLTLSSMHFIKMKYLFQAELMNIGNPLLDKIRDLDLYETYFTCIHNKEDENYQQIALHIEKNILPLMGEEYANRDILNKKFEIDMEYLLYTITFDGSNDAYKRINTIKVALNINNSDWHMWGIDTIKLDVYKEKKEQEKVIEKGTYYYKNIVKEFIPSLNKINKDIAKKIANDYEEIYEEMVDNGYKVLYMLICE